MSYNTWSRTGFGCRFTDLKNQDKIREFFVKYYPVIKNWYNIDSSRADYLFRYHSGAYWHLNRSLTEEDIKNIDFSDVRISYHSDNYGNCLLSMKYPVKNSDKFAVIDLDATETFALIINDTQGINVICAFEPGDYINDSEKAYPNCDKVPYFGVGECFPWQMRGVNGMEEEDFAENSQK